VPKIVDAFRIVAEGVTPDLQPTKLVGRVPINPATQDFFRAAIEERKRVTARTDWSEADRGRVGQAIKVFANAASYGIYAEMHRQPSNEEMEVQCHGIDPTPFSGRVAHPEVPGEFCFPPVASLVTAAARLMLALLEYVVTTKGGRTRWKIPIPWRLWPLRQAASCPVRVDRSSCRMAAPRSKRCPGRM